MRLRLQIAMPLELKRRAHARAADQGISVAEYIRRLVAEDLGPPKPRRKPDISIMFDVVKDGPRANIARDKDRLVGEAVGDNYLRKVGRRPKRRRLR
jgi:hypothetical protein